MFNKTAKSANRKVDELAKKLGLVMRDYPLIEQTIITSISIDWRKQLVTWEDLEKIVETQNLILKYLQVEVINKQATKETKELVKIKK